MNTLLHTTLGINSSKHVSYQIRLQEIKISISNQTCWFHYGSCLIMEISFPKFKISSIAYNFLKRILHVTNYNLLFLYSLIRFCSTNLITETLIWYQSNCKIVFLIFTVLGQHMLIKLHRFQVYNSTTQHLHIVLCSPPQVISFHHHLSPFTLFYLNPTPFPVATATLLSVSVRFFSLIPSPFIPRYPRPLPSNSYQSVLSTYESVPILLVYFIH